MSRHIYVGPYLKVSQEAKELLFEDQYCDLVAEVSGEYSDNNEWLYMVSNQHIPGIDRELSFGPEDIFANYRLHNQADELMAFGTQVFPLIQELRDSHISYKLEWGLVTGWF